MWGDEGGVRLREGGREMMVCWTEGERDAGLGRWRDDGVLD